MTPLATLSEHNMWTRFLNDTDDSNNGWPVKIYEWAMSLTILIVMLSVVWKKLQSAASDDQDADATDIETGDNNTDPERSLEEEAEFKKNFIFKLFQSEHIEEVRFDIDTKTPASKQGALLRVGFFATE